MANSPAVSDNPHYLGGIGDWLRHNRDVRPEKTALVVDDKRVNYRALDSRTNQFAHFLHELGVEKGDRVAILMHNSIEFIEALFGCAKLGVVVVPVNYRLGVGEIEFILNDTESKVLIAGALFKQQLTVLERACACLQHIVISVTSEGLGGMASSKEVNYQDAFHFGTSDRKVDVAFADPLIIMYTSGTTGSPKGAVLTHQSITWNIINTMLGPASMEYSDVVLGVAPLFHIGGLNIHVLPALYIGATVVLQNKFEPLDALQAIVRERVSILFLVPAMWRALSQVLEFDDFDLSSLRKLASGGAPCPVSVIRFYQDRGLKFSEGFGMTEGSPGVCMLDDESAVRKHGSVGKPKPNIQVRIVNETDDDVPDGATGELVVRGPSIFDGYWRRPEATREAFRGGWFHTGDLAMRDDEGFYYIVDRKKDMLISGGENVYPAEIEKVLLKHEKIYEAAVIGVPDDQWGEVPKIIAMIQGDHPPTLEELQEFCSRHLARFKIPRYLEIVDDFPRTATGKVKKRELRSS